MATNGLEARIAELGERLVRERKTPCATYRLQMSKSFTFRDALALVPYLYDLGISHIYSSPILRAVPGSTHGYDICDYSMLNPELGSADDFDALVSALHERGMGLIVDTVPNHMGINSDCNRWWMDVLEFGPASEYAGYFDIDWHPVKPELEDRVLLPILEDQYGVVLEAGKFRVEYAEDAFSVTYGVRHLPIAARTYRVILEDVMAQFSPPNEGVQELQQILATLDFLHESTAYDPDARARRREEIATLKRRLAALVAENADIRTALEHTVTTLNGTPGDPLSFDRLDTLITAQSYRAAFWRVAGEEINYRRFFDINGMAAIRVECPEVFRDTHAFLLNLVAEGKIDGLRIDHPDGLWDPSAYFRQLQAAYLMRVAQRELPDEDPAALEQAAIAWIVSRAPTDLPPLYVIVEKILSETEPLPASWAVDGTTGYDFLNLVNGLFINPANEGPLNSMYNRVAGDVPPFRRLEVQSKRMIMQDSLAGEVNALAHQLERISERNRHTRDFTLNGLLSAIREIIACMAIYRTYVTATEGVSERDVKYIEAAVADARRHNPQTSQAAFEFLRETLLLRNLNEFPEANRPDIVAFVMKFQQVTSPVMAKSVEDTAFYIYNRLVSLNEVGGTPVAFGTSLADFHRDNERRARQWPHAMIATSTHDTKRSEGVRARLNVLSELADEWSAAVDRWRALNAVHKTTVDGEPAPDSNDEYLLYQALIGALPMRMESDSDWADFKDRIVAYMAKATHEAKVHTSWTNANEAYDQSVTTFVTALLDSGDENEFVRDFGAFQRRIAYFGLFNSLSQTLLKLTSPGVPDIYRGTELWDFSLVDPDNRRPVDFELRRRLLDGFRSQTNVSGAASNERANRLLGKTDEGRLKLFVIWTALQYRRAHSRLFAEGSYTPLQATGDLAEYAVAFERSAGDERLVVVAPRLVATLTGGVERPPLGADVWGETCVELTAGHYRDLLTGSVISAGNSGALLADVLSTLPLALLVPAEQA